ncbi:MAG: hypothetical protein IKJ94_03115 [Oscillospiraceae bacterium]|nr:hypothetical protein [Oscillospiraceae bacterium]
MLLGMVPMYGFAQETNGIDNSNLTLNSSGYADCPVCKSNVKWTAVSGELTATKWLQPDTHYYLSGDVTYTGTDYGFGYSKSGTQTTCLHLNGHNITSTTGKAASFGGGIVNIMGNGIVSGSGTAYGGATIHTWGSGTLNLYGGTFTKGASQYPVIYLNAYTVNMYSGATVDGTGTTPGNYALVLAENDAATMTMYGGTIQNGNSVGACGNVRFYKGTFNMQGGTVENGTGTVGGNLYLYNTGKANISGGQIKNGSVYVAASDLLTLSGTPKLDNLVVPADITVQVNTLAQGAQITISADCAVSTSENLQEFVKAGYFITRLEGKVVMAKDGFLVIADAPAEEPGAGLPTYIPGAVLYETDFENETLGQLPSGWSAGYSEGSAENGTLTSFGWGIGGTLTAQVETLGDYGKAFHFASGNNDAFAAMGEIPTTNYLYEAEVYVERGYGSFGLANNYYASTHKATGALFSAIYPKGDAAKYTYKGAGLSGSQLWSTSYSPDIGDIIKLQILSLNGKNYILYGNELVAQCDARLQGQGVDHPGFYTCYGGIYVLNVKVTEVFAADVRVDAARVDVTDGTAMELEIAFDKAQGLYAKYAAADSSKLSFGAVVLKNGDENAELTKETQGATVLSFTEKTEDTKKILCTAVLPVVQADYESAYCVRPFVEADGICFYGDMGTYVPAQLAKGAYLSATSETEKAQLAAAFAGCEHFTAAGSKEVAFTLFSDFHYVAGMYPATISDLKTILRRAEDANASFVLSAGDFTNDMAGSPELYNTYRNYVTAAGKVLPAYNVYGNHELEFGNSMETVTWTLTNDQYTDHTVVWGTEDGSFDDYIGYYYFESDGFRVIALDSEHSYNPTTGQWEHNRPGSSGAPSGNLYSGSLGPVQLSWLEKVLMDAASKDIPCIVVAHDGFTGMNWGNTSPDSEAVRALYKKANTANPGTVLMSINGHIHTDHQGWNDGVFYLDTNTVRNNWWQETAVEHYTDEHTFMFEEYDTEGNLIATYPKKYSELTMGKKTWFSEEPISCTVTLSESGVVSIDGVKSQWAYDVVPTAASTVSGVECEITSGLFWDCARDGHLEKRMTTETEYYTACANAQCTYESAPKAHNGILLQLSDGTVLFPADTASAVAAHLENPDSYLKLYADGLVFALTEKQTVCMDLNGKQATITGNGTLKGFDSANDAYTISAGAATVADTVTVQKDVTVAGKRYIAITEAGSTSFHRLEMEICDVSLRTSACGIYYQAKFSCDSVLAKKVSAYGVALSVYNMPGENFRTEMGDNNVYTVLTPDADFGNGTVATSGAVFNIMKTTTAKTNAKRGGMPIYANGYMVVDGQVLVADRGNMNRKVTTEGFTGVAMSLLDVLKAVDNNWAYYTQNGQAEDVKAFYETWADYGMNAWADQFENIG